MPMLWTRRCTEGPRHRTVVIIDIAGSARWNNLAQLHARTTLDRMVKSAFRKAGAPWRRLAVQERGDGMLVLVPPAVPKAAVLDPMITRLAASLREYNTIADPAYRLRLRMSVHAGEILRTPTGWVSTDINLACRLIDSHPAYHELAQNPDTDLVVVVSELIHHTIVRQGYGTLDPNAYRRVHVRLKETDQDAWLTSHPSTIRPTHPSNPPTRPQVEIAKLRYTWARLSASAQTLVDQLTAISPTPTVALTHHKQQQRQHRQLGNRQITTRHIDIWPDVPADTP